MDLYKFAAETVRAAGAATVETRALCSETDCNRCGDLHARRTPHTRYRLGDLCAMCRRFVIGARQNAAGDSR